MVTYGPTKYIGALWMSSMARKHPDLRFVTVSPGATSGTSAADAMSGPQRLLMKYLAMPMMNLFGMMHGLEAGAKRYVDAVTDGASFKSGVFYGSQDGKTTGALVDQSTIFGDLANSTYQDNASEALHRFISS